VLFETVPSRPSDMELSSKKAAEDEKRFFKANERPAR
jgi:hypothetical protein